MGEYYSWVNVDRKEYIDPSYFGYGSKFHESMHKDSIPLHALHTLLLDEWKGNRILWLGDECKVSDKSSNKVIQRLYEQSVEFGSPGCLFDVINEMYKNVSGLFKESEEDVREEIGFYLEKYAHFLNHGGEEPLNEFGVSLKSPYEGLFHKTAKRCKYMINYSKKIYYSLDETTIRFQDHTINDFSDPLPLLMGYGRVTEPGEWLGDVIGVSDQCPEGYLLVKELYVDW